MADDARRLYYAMRCCPLWHLRAALYAHVLKLPIIWNETICDRYSSASCRLQFGCELDIAKLDCISFYEITSKNQNELCNPWLVFARVDENKVARLFPGLAYKLGARASAGLQLV